MEPVEGDKERSDLPMTAGWRARLAAEDRLRDSARTLYLEKRGDLAAMIVRNLEPDLDEVNFTDLARKVTQWMTEWEVPERRVKRRAYALLEPDYRLKEMVEQVAKLKDLLDVALEVQKTAPLPWGPQAISVYYNKWTDAKDRLDKLEADMGVKEEAVLNTPKWRELRGKAYTKIFRDYKGKGEIYTMLCQRLASLYVALQKLEEDGRAETPTFIEFQDRFTVLAGQVQKHTEVMKTAIFDVQEIGTKFLSIVERILGGQYPQLFDRIVDAVEDKAPELTEGDWKLLPERVP